MAVSPDGHWWDTMPDILQGMRQLPSWSTGLSPFLLQHKQFPELTLTEGLLVDVEEDVSWDNLVD